MSESSDRASVQRFIEGLDRLEELHGGLYREHRNAELSGFHVIRHYATDRYEQDLAKKLRPAEETGEERAVIDDFRQRYGAAIRAHRKWTDAKQKVLDAVEAVASLATGRSISPKPLYELRTWFERKSDGKLHEDVDPARYVVK